MKSKLLAPRPMLLALVIGPISACFDAASDDDVLEEDGDSSSVSGDSGSDSDEASGSEDSSSDTSDSDTSESDTSDSDTSTTDTSTTDTSESDTSDSDTSTTDTSDPPDPECGNGLVEGDEACDDGNANDIDECTNACTVLEPATGTLYVVERMSGQLSAVDGQGQVTTIMAGLQDPMDVALLPGGNNLLVTERNLGNCVSGYLTEVAPDLAQEVHTVATGQFGFSPNNLFVDEDDAVYVSAFCGGVWRRVGPEAFAKVSNVPGDVQGMTRFNGDVYASNAVGQLYRIDVTGADLDDIQLVLAGLGTTHDLATNGTSMYTNDNVGGRLWKIDLVDGVFQPEVVTDLVFKASATTSDGGGFFYIAQQMVPGSILRFGPDEVLEAFVFPTNALQVPRGLAFRPD